MVNAAINLGMAAAFLIELLNTNTLFSVNATISATV